MDTAIYKIDNTTWRGQDYEISRYWDSGMEVEMEIEYVEMAKYCKM